MFAKGQTVIQLFELFAPKHYALPDDKIGLQLGTLQKEINKVLITLDVTIEVVEEAIREQADLIIAHHPIIYRPLNNIVTDSVSGKLYEMLIKHNIAVYIAHTNLDVADGGINDMMAMALQLTDVTYLKEEYTDRLSKLVVFVPEGHQDKVLQAMFAAGAGWLGQYSHCSFAAEGLGTFMPQEGTDPFIGKSGRLEQVRELRIETVVPQSVQRRVVQAMLKAHPYEETAYDLYPLDIKGKSLGIGRLGKLSDATSLRALAELVKTAYDVPMVRVVGDLDRKIRKVAILGGAGSRYVKHAIFAGADVLVTGDIDYHTAHDALAAGLAIIDPGHNVEKIMKSQVAAYLSTKLQEKKYATIVIASKVNTEPFSFL